MDFSVSADQQRLCVDTKCSLEDLTWAIDDRGGWINDDYEYI